MTPSAARAADGRIFTRVALFSCLLVVGTVGLYLALTLPFQRRVNTEHLRSDAESVAVSIAQVTATAIITEDYSAAIDHCAKVLQQSESLRYVVIARKDGFALVQTKAGWKQEQLSGIWTSVAAPLGSFTDTGLVSERVFHYTYPFEYSGIDWGYIHIGVSLKKFNSDTWALYTQTALVALVCLLGGFFAAFYFARQLTTPIRTLDAVTQRVAEGDLSAVAEVHTRDELERLAGSFNLMTDSLRRAQKQLLASREYTANIIKSLNEALVVTDMDNRITAINVAAADLLGRPEAELVGQPVGAFFSSGAQDTSGRLIAGEIEQMTRDGRKVPVLLSVSAIKDDAGGLQGLAYSALDITNRKRVEKALIAAKDAAEAATRSKSQFLATMSHEIRTPMNGVLGMTELLLATELTEKQRHFAETSDASARKLLTLLNDLLDFSKIEAGKLTLRKTAFDLRVAVSEVVALLSDKATARGVTLASSSDPELPSSIMGDAIRFNQVLVNLVGNAIKFTESGSIDVDVRLPSRAGKQMIRVSVTDTGVGIAPSAQAAIFEAFAQADSSSRRQFQGTGLGLAISRQLVGLMGGTLAVRSEVGKGSTFWFEIPFEPAPSAVQARKASMSAGQPSKLNGRVLLAEDNPINQDVARAMLGLIGLDVVVASDGYEALRAASTSNFDVILMDCQMPGMDGYAATRAIRTREMQANGEGAHPVPIIAMTAFAMKTDRDDCLAAGMTDYLSKPFTRSELHAILEKYLCEGAPVASATSAMTPDSATLAPVLPPIDSAAFATIENLEALGATGVVQRVLSAYLSEAPPLLERLEAALREVSADELSRAAHSLKSSSSNVGALVLSSLCQQAEALGRSGTCAGATAIVDSIRSEFGRVRETLEVRLASESKANTLRQESL